MDFERCSNCVNISIRKLCGDCKSQYKKLLIKNIETIKRKHQFKPDYTYISAKGHLKIYVKNVSGIIKPSIRETNALEKALKMLTTFHLLPRLRLHPTQLLHSVARGGASGH